MLAHAIIEQEPPDVVKRYFIYKNGRSPLVYRCSWGRRIYIYRYRELVGLLGSLGDIMRPILF